MPKITYAKRNSAPPSSSDELNTRNLLQKYDLGKLLGCGSFGKVYHARDLNTGHSVAIKSIRKNRILRLNLTEQIHREVSIMRTLAHPHIIHLHEVLATKTKIYFVMEFAKGGELFAKLTKGRFSEELSRKYFQQLISALSYCHSRGVYHRDLKPENLLLDENWDLRVTDFGLSAVGPDQIRPDGMLHTLCGTPAYVAPEILAKQGYDGEKIDVWSSGVILFVLIAGYLPFNDFNLMAMYRKIHKGEFRCPKWTSPDLKSLLTRILDPNPNTRISVREILIDPWFKKGYREISSRVEREFELKDEGEARFLNAFDLISYSSGADLSGLFGNVIKGEIFVSDESPEAIIERIENFAKEEGMRVAKKGIFVRLQGQNGNSVVMAEMNRLTEGLVVVNVRTNEFARDIWNRKLKPRMNDLYRKPEERGAGITVTS